MTISKAMTTERLKLLRAGERFFLVDTLTDKKLPLTEAQFKKLKQYEQESN
jgi:hypothetical protein